MKILFDANVPAPLARHLLKHHVTSAGELAWQELENGALLLAAEESGFDVLVTCDQNLRNQQNLEGRKLAILILSTNHWATLRSKAARIATAFDFIQAGKIVALDVAEL